MNNYVRKESSIQTSCKKVNQFMLNNFNFSKFVLFSLFNRKNQFLKNLILLRMKLLSEEMLYKKYKTIKTIKDFIKRNNCHVSNSNCNNILTHRSNIFKTVIRQE